MTLLVIYCDKFKWWHSVLDESFNCSNSFSLSVMPSLSMHVTKFGQKKHHRPKSWRRKQQPQNNLFEKRKQLYYWFFDWFWFKVSLITLITFFSQLHKKYFWDRWLVELINQLFCITIHRPVWLVGKWPNFCLIS